MSINDFQWFHTNKWQTPPAAATACAELRQPTVGYGMGLLFLTQPNWPRHVTSSIFICAALYVHEHCCKSMDAVAQAQRCHTILGLLQSEPQPARLIFNLGTQVCQLKVFPEALLVEVSCWICSSRVFRCQNASVSHTRRSVQNAKKEHQQKKRGEPRHPLSQPGQEGQE